MSGGSSRPGAASRPSTPPPRSADVIDGHGHGHGPSQDADTDANPSHDAGHAPVAGVVGIGIDVCAVARLQRALARTPRLAQRLFTDAERTTSSGKPRAVEGLAARFAAKEAVAKALGSPPGLRWREAEVVTTDRGRPELRVHGAVADAAAAVDVRRWHVSLSHDGGIATAVVLAVA